MQIYHQPEEYSTGEKQENGKHQKVIEYGYFISKIKDKSLNFLTNRFNEKYVKSQELHIRFFDEQPLSIRKARYNQSGLVCYCNYDETEARQKIEGKWTNVKCTEECNYRNAGEGKKPSCSYEGTLKFLLPDISQDRIFIMKVTGYTSIFRLKKYIEFQKYLGNSIIGDYYLFLKKESQTNKEGKTFENYILDIVKKEDFISNNPTKQDEVSTIRSKNVDKTIQNLSQSENNTPKKEKRLTITNNNETECTEHQDISNDNFKNYHVLVESYEKELIKDGTPTKYLFATFIDQNNVTVNAVISPQFKEELSKCDAGTIAILDLKTAGKSIIANDIKFVKKCPKNIAAQGLSMLPQVMKLLYKKIIKNTILKQENLKGDLKYENIYI